MCVANGLYHNIFCMIKGRLNAMCSDGLWLDSISAALGAAQRAVGFIGLSLCGGGHHQLGAVVIF
jgi:hypothetical protein